MRDEAIARAVTASAVDDALARERERVADDFFVVAREELVRVGRFALEIGDVELVGDRAAGLAPRFVAGMKKRPIRFVGAHGLAAEDRRVGHGRREELFAEERVGPHPIRIDDEVRRERVAIHVLVVLEA